MLTQIASIIISYENIMYFCYKLQKMYNSICVFAPKKFWDAQNRDEKIPRRFVPRGIACLVCYGVIAENAL